MSFARLLRTRAESEPLRIEVSGPSMGRTILSGASVWVSASPRPRWGEIWAFCESPGSVAVHRFVGRRGSRNRFWGDGNSEADALVDDSMLIGRVVAIQQARQGRREIDTRREFLRACRVGVRRLPRRVWYRSRGAIAPARRRS